MVPRIRGIADVLAGLGAAFVALLTLCSLSSSTDDSGATSGEATPDTPPQPAPQPPPDPDAVAELQAKGWRTKVERESDRRYTVTLEREGEDETGASADLAWFGQAVGSLLRRLARPQDSSGVTDHDDRKCHREIPQISGWDKDVLCFIAALADSAVFFVGLMAVGIVVVYLEWGGGWWTFAGIGAAAVVWGIIGLVRYRFAVPSRARARSYWAFLGRLKAVEHRLCILKEQEHCSSDAIARTIEDVEAYLAALFEQLAAVDLRWVRGEGYVHLWENLNRAEEALLIDTFEALAVGEGLHLESRLHESKVPNAQDLLSKVRRAVADLDPASLIYLKQQPPQQIVAVAGVTEQQKKGAALLALREVSMSMNEFRAERWAGIARARNALLDISVMVGLALCALIGLASIRDINKDLIAVGALFYLVGVLAGWFHWWWVEESGEKLVDDFGLRAARLVATIILSGTAALFGVVAVQLWDDIKDFDITVAVEQSETPSALETPSGTQEFEATPTSDFETPALADDLGPGTPESESAGMVGLLANQDLDGTPVTATDVSDATEMPTPSATATATPAPGEGIGRMRRTFDLDHNLVGIFVAAVFGYAPQVLVQIMQRPTERYKNDLRSTEATNGS